MYSLTPFDNVFSPFDAFAGFFGDSMPMDTCRTDIRDEGDSLVIESELPGFDKDNITVDISDGFLTLNAVHNAENDEKDENGRYIRRERSCSSYQRTFDISGIDADNISAECKNGILTMRLPKKQQTVSESKRLQIN